jgi:hypothetical protein
VFWALNSHEHGEDSCAEQNGCSSRHEENWEWRLHIGAEQLAEVLLNIKGFHFDGRENRLNRYNDIAVVAVMDQGLPLWQQEKTGQTETTSLLSSM